jgi:putative membrane protein
MLAEKFGRVSGKLADISDKLGKLKKADKDTWPEIKAAADELLKSIEQTKNEAGSIKAEVSSDIDKKVNKAVADANKAISDVSDSLDDAYGDLSTLSGSLREAQSSLSHLMAGLDETAEAIGSMQQGAGALAMMFNAISQSDALDDVNVLLSSDPEKIAQFISAPVGMKTETIYPVENYGSAMAPFYTVLAQWVGALLAAVLISSSIKKREGLGNLRLFERFAGRYRLFLFIGLAQALIVSIGDLFYAGIQCEHPGLFILAACVNGVCFTMINYALIFALHNIGLGIGVIILVLQVAGSGGTYPVEVLPPVFRVLYPVMPFKYAMGAMKECLCGMYGDTYARCLSVLILMTLCAAALGLLLYYPSLRLNRMIAISMKKSDVMIG